MKKVIIFSAGFLFAVYVVCGGLKAQEKDFDIALPDFSAAQIESGETLGLEEASRLALADHLGIQVAALEQEIAELDIPIARAIYDTNFEAFGQYFHSKKEQPSVVLGSREIQGSLGAALDKELPTGTGLRLEGGVERHSTDSVFSSANRNYQSYVEVSVTQPLLENFFGYQSRKKIKQVKINTEKMTYQKLREIENDLYDVRTMYWNLVWAAEVYKARMKALDKAREFFEITREKEEIGLSEKPDVYAALANVKQKLVDALVAKNNWKTASYELRAALRVPEVELIVPEPPPAYMPFNLPAGDILQETLKSRWEIRELNLELENQAIEVKLKKNKLLPNLEFRGAYRSTSLDRDMAKSEGEAFGFNHPVYEASVNLGTPIEMNEEKSELKQARLAYEKLDKQKEDLIWRVSKELDFTLRNLELTEQTLDQSRGILALQTEKLKEEEVQFGRGRSDSKTIIDYQDDVIRAALESIRALIDYEKAIEDFHHVRNRLFEYAGVDKPAWAPAEQVL